MCYIDVKKKKKKKCQQGSVGRKELCRPKTRAAPVFMRRAQLAQVCATPLITLQSGLQPWRQKAQTQQRNQEERVGRAGVPSFQSLCQAKRLAVASHFPYTLQLPIHFFCFWTTHFCAKCFSNKGILSEIGFSWIDQTFIPYSRSRKYKTLKYHKIRTKSQVKNKQRTTHAL